MSTKLMLKFRTEELENLYISQKLNMKQIADIYSVTPATIFYHLNKHGIKTRCQKETFNFKGHKHSESSLSAMSAFQNGKYVSQETKDKMSESHKLSGIGHKKIRQDGYISIYYPTHLSSNKCGYIMEHILVMEKIIGRYLLPGEVVHHKNFIKNDNREENLQLMTKSEHMSLHSKIRWGKNNA